jgi:methylamine dehydrogenase heavy chain
MPVVTHFMPHRISPVRHATSWVVAMLASIVLPGISATATNAPSDKNHFPAPLLPDSGDSVAKLPAEYPRTWAFVAYGNDKFEILDVGTDAREVKGQLPAHESATALIATHRPEIYVADTVWSRGNRGIRTDYITVYSKQTLSPIAEIELPGAKRALVVPMQGMFSFANDERFGLVFNFTPAASVTVVNLEKRRVLAEVPTPGCSLAYSTGPLGFSSFCSGGTLLTVQLDERGEVKSRNESHVFNKLDTDPLFTSSADIAGVRYFPSFHGRVQPIDLTSAEPKILPDWALVSPEEERANWRPSGLELVAAGDDGLLYVLMQPDGHEGSHKEAGSEVWAFDPKTHTRLVRLRLVRAGTSIEVTHDKSPLLLVATSEQLDVYSLPQGQLVRSLDAPARRGGLLMEAIR